METLADPAHRQMTLEPREGLFGLFGWNTVSKDAKQVRSAIISVVPYTKCVFLIGQSKSA